MLLAIWALGLGGGCILGTLSNLLDLVSRAFSQMSFSMETTSGLGKSCSRGSAFSSIPRAEL